MIAQLVENKHVPRLRKQVGGHAAQHKHGILTQKHVVCLLHGGVDGRKRLREQHQHKCEHLAHETAQHHRLSFAFAPNFANNVGHKEGERVTKYGSWKNNVVAEQGNSSCEGFCSHHVGNNQRNNKNHGAQH